jgi:hypothetical protein
MKRLLGAMFAASCTIVCVAVLPAAASSLNISFQKIADTDTPIPGGGVNFTAFHAPALDGVDVAFGGSGPGVWGVFAHIGGLGAVATTNTPIPGGTGNFWGAGAPSIDGGHVAFSGTGSGAQRGIYTDVGGLHVVVNNNTLVPGTGATFQGLGAPSLNAGNVAFIGTHLSGGYGIYVDNGTLSVVANGNTPLPGGTGSFDLFLGRGPSFDGGNVAFHGYGNNGQSGIYTDVGGLQVVANRATPIPGGSGNFDDLFTPSFDADQVAFFARGTGGQQGVYTDIGGLSIVANTDTPIPDGSGNFIGFGELVSLSGGSVAFVGEGVGGQLGVYTELAGSLHKVIDLGDSLDGKTLSSLELGSEGLSGLSIAFHALFTDGSEGIYIATIPEPSTFWLLLLALPATPWLRPRIRKGSE